MAMSVLALSFLPSEPVAAADPSVVVPQSDGRPPTNAAWIWVKRYEGPGKSPRCS
jgi:hypothetical protein